MRVVGWRVHECDDIYPLASISGGSPIYYYDNVHRKREVKTRWSGEKYKHSLTLSHLDKVEQENESAEG